MWEVNLCPRQWRRSYALPPLPLQRQSLAVMVAVCRHYDCGFTAVLLVPVAYLMLVMVMIPISTSHAD